MADVVEKPFALAPSCDGNTRTPTSASRSLSLIFSFTIALFCTSCGDGRSNANGGSVNRADINGNNGGAVPPSQTGSAAARVLELRRNLSETVGDYATALDPSKLVPATIERFRSELARLNVKSVNALTSSDAVLATLRASADHTRELINAYEDAAGLPNTGQRTTALNVHSREELVTLRERARSALVSVGRARQSVSAVVALEIRDREIRTVLQSIDNELASRRGDGAPGLIAMDPSVTVDQARERSKKIDPIEANGFLRHLRLQVELRSQANSQDAHLAALRTELNTRGPPEPPPGGSRDAPWPRPPVRPPGRPRPPPPASDAVVDLARATYDEASNLANGNLSEVASARARIEMYSKWLQTFAGNVTESPELAVLTDEQLFDARDIYTRFLLALERTPLGEGVPWKKELALARRRAIDHEIERRAFNAEATAWGKTLVDDLTAMPTNSARQAFERRAGAVLAHEEAVEAQKLLDSPIPLRSIELNYLAARSSVESLRLDCLALSSAWRDVQSVRRSLLIDGRGDALAQRARDLDSTEAALRSAAADLSGRIAATHASVPEAAALRAFAGDHGSVDIQKALTKVEAVRAAAEHPQIVVVEIAHGAVAAASDGAAEHITLPERRPPVFTAAASRPKNFEDLFPTTERWTKSATAVIEDLPRAPGGVVIDSSLPLFGKEQIERARIDPAHSTVSVRLNGRWLRVLPAVSTETLRAAWAYVTLGSAVAVDLRGLNDDEALYLGAMYASERLSLDEKVRLTEEFTKFTSVNLNPAVANTRIGTDLVAIDQLVFDLLPNGGLRGEEGDSVSFDIPQLRRDIVADTRERLADPALWSDTYKSIVTFTHVQAAVDGDTVALRPHVAFIIATVPVENGRVSGIRPLRLRRSSDWFNRNAAQLLRTYKPLRDVAEFTCAVALFRAVAQSGIPNNFGTLVAIPTASVDTPRFLCRSRLRNGCQPESLRQLLQPTNGDRR